MDYKKGSLVEYLTNNRRLKLEEYDNNGNIVDVREFDDEDMFRFFYYTANYGGGVKVARKKDRDMFNEQELKTIDNMFYKGQIPFDNGGDPVFWFAEVEAQIFRDIFNNYTANEVAFALSLSDERNGRELLVHLKSEYHGIKFNFEAAIDFIRSRDGIYYAVNDEGKRVYDFVDKPTKKQVAYQRTKNGNRCVYLSFKDWKEYAISENELE